MNGDHEEVCYAVKIISDGTPMNEDGTGKEMMIDHGTEFWICTYEWGETGRRTINSEMPSDVKTFKTRDEARKYASSWRPHPWYVKPREWRIVEVVPRYVRSGWREA